MFKSEKSCLILILLVSLSQCSIIRVDSGVYSRVSIEISHQPQPSDCPQFFARLESVLNETSYGLHQLSNFSGYIGDFQIIIPPSWDITQCQPSRFSRIVPSAHRSSSPDFYISSSHDLEEPRTEQFGPCGSKGYRVHVPMSFLDFTLHQNSWELKQRGQTLLREWSKYIYGVFPEQGFKGDPLYPTMYADGNEMKFSKGCSGHKGSSFCLPNQTYDKYAPSKQNLLCNGQSASQIILRSPDFLQTDSPLLPELVSNETGQPPPQIKGRVEITPKGPSFNYVVGKSSTFSILLDRTSIMGINNRWTNIKRAFYRFIQYLPVGTQLNIISFGSESVIDLPSTIVTDSNREGLHGRIPRKVLEDENYGCVSCALNLSLSSMVNYLGETEPGNVIIISGSPSQPNQMRDLLEVIHDAPVHVFPIVYPGTAHPDIVSYAKYGKQYVVPEGTDSLAILSETLMDILKEAEGIPIQKVHETKHARDLEVSGTFTMEEDILHKMSVTLTIDDEERVEFFEITNPSGEKHLFSKFEDGMVVFNIPGRAESGIWTYHAKLYPEIAALNDMSVDVVSQSNDERSEPFLLEAFSSIGAHEVNAYDPSSPVILYARLTKGPMRPVLKALVVARIHRPGEAEPIELVMKDNGLGYPDVTKNDGIYSVYFSEFASIPGFYSVQVYASHNEGLARTPKNMKLREEEETVQSDDGRSFNNANIEIHTYEEPISCCGSVINYEETIPASPFHRQTVGNGFYVRQGLSGGNDVAPPSRVLDLRVHEYIENSLYIKLKWSAPGGDYDKGKASKYEIRCYTSREALEGSSFSDKGILVHSSFTPEPLAYGQEQSCRVGIPWPNEKFYYALLAFDESGNPSPISNVASAFVYEAPTTLPMPQDPPEGSVVEGTLPFMESTGTDVYERSKQVRVYVITGTVVGLLLLILALIGLILLRTRSKRAEFDGEDEKETYKTYETNESSKAATNSESVSKPTPNLNDWLDSLPRSSRSPETSQDFDGTLPKRNTKVQSSPYRHKVLTNGSFLNLKESCDESSSRPTTSTTDPDSNSEHSGDSSSPNRQAPSSILKRSNTLANPPPIDTDTARAIIDTYTSGTLLNRSPNYFSFRGEGPTDPMQGFHSDYHPARQLSHKKKRTESVV